MMKNIVPLILLISVGFLLYQCTPQQDAEAKDKAKTEIEEQVFPVKVQPLETDTIQRTVEQTATLKAFEEVYLAPASPGRIEKIYVETGDHITKDQLLVQMDKTQLHQATIQLKTVETEFRRVDTLYKYGSIAEQKYDQVKSQYDIAKSNVDFLLENTQLRSPLNGIVTNVLYEDGEMFSGAPNTQAGKAAVVVLMQIQPLKADINISETYFPLIRKGMKSKIRTDIYAEKVFTGEVFRVYPTIDPMNRTFKTEVKIQNQGEILRPGMFARVEIDLYKTESLIVPVNVIVQQEGTNNRYVFVHKNGVAHKTEIKPGKRYDEHIEIVSGNVKKGDEIIVAGQTKLMDKSKVKVVDNLD
jgi:membrane fusion protein, multidrug efflux system